MASSFGRLFTITTWGESHGPALGVVIDGCPAGLPITIEEIQHDLDRRRVGQSIVTSTRDETDRAEILSGVYEGMTTGTPILLVTFNKDHRSKNYDNLKDVFRPGHADYTYWAKYGHRDHRGGGRSSARETWGRVAAGAIAKKLLATIGVDIYGYAAEIGGIAADSFDRAEIEQNIVRSPDPVAAVKMIDAINAARKYRDSLGGIVEVRASGVPVGLGDPTFDKLDALIGMAMLSIPATKGVEIGGGFGLARSRGSLANDPFVVEDGVIQTASNNAGGMLGGISSGEEIVVRVALKPTSSISREQATVDRHGEAQKLLVEGRHDPCVVPRAVPIVEAMLALVLADLMLVNRAARVAFPV
jgi:chorismate synthase